MARRSKRSRGSRSRGKSRSSGPDWRKSQFVAYILIGFLVIFWAWWLWPEGSGGIPAELQDFPYTYMPEGVTGVENVVILEGKHKMPPVEQDDQILWEAYKCTFEECPGRTEEHPFVFPLVLQKVEIPEGEEMPPDMPEYDSMAIPECPACREKGVGGPEYVERYQTEEGEERLRKMRERFSRNRDN